MSPLRLVSSRQLVVTAVGCVLIGVGVACVLDARLGADPYTVFIDGVAIALDLPISVALVVSGAGMTVAAWVFGRRPSWGLTMTVGLVGAVVGVFGGRFGEPERMVGQVGLMLGGLLLVGLGVGTYRSVRWAEGPLDSLPQALSDRGGNPTLMFALVQLTLLIVGWLLGGQVGVGTVVAVLVLGPTSLRTERLIRATHGPFRPTRWRAPPEL